MKVRNGFVSNSSSSSFILLKSKLSTDQILLIENHGLCKTIPYADTDTWSVDEYSDPDVIKLWTCMDNFNMEEYLKEVVRVPADAYIDEYEYQRREHLTSGQQEAERILHQVKGV